MSSARWACLIIDEFCLQHRNKLTALPHHPVAEMDQVSLHSNAKRLALSLIDTLYVSGTIVKGDPRDSFGFCEKVEGTRFRSASKQFSSIG